MARKPLDTSGLVNGRQFSDLLDSLSDPREKAFINFMYGQVLRVGELGDIADPISEFDLVFFANSMRKAFKRRKILVEILAGDYMVDQWFVDK